MISTEHHDPRLRAAWIIMVALVLNVCAADLGIIAFLSLGRLAAAWPQASEVGVALIGWLLPYFEACVFFLALWSFFAVRRLRREVGTQDPSYRLLRLVLWLNVVLWFFAALGSLVQAVAASLSVGS